MSEREWADIMSYFPGLPEVITRVDRDEKFIAAMKTLLQDFLGMFDTRLAKLKALGYLDELAAKKVKAESDGAFGISASDLEDYIASLKASGKLPADKVQGAK